MRWRQVTLWGALAAWSLAWLLAACDSGGGAPPPPPASGNAKEDEDEDNDNDDDSPVTTPLGTGTSTGFDECSRSSYDLGGKSLGTEDPMTDEVANCHKTGKFYSRIKVVGGECTQSPLARIDCSTAGLDKILTGQVRNDWQTKMAGDYSGYMIDQCVICPENNIDPTCVDDKGARQTGTKVYFAKLNGTSIYVRALVIPTVVCSGSPAPGGSGIATGTGTGTTTATATGTGTGITP